MSDFFSDEYAWGWCELLKKKIHRYECWKKKCPFRKKCGGI